MAKPVDVEGLWRDAQAAFREHRFSDAISLTEEYIANKKHNPQNEAACQKLVNRAEALQEMMESIEDVTILDSAKCPKSTFLQYYGIQKDVGRLRMENGGVSFTTGRGDRSIVAERNGKNYDLWLVYSDGERRKLSDIVNTTANENYPFELSDGVTLYFASDGHNSIGGYDIFMTRYNNETFEYSEPMHLGMPFNSLYNDYMMVVDELASVGWFATDRFQSKDSVVIYKFRVEEKKRILPTELDSDLLRASALLRRYRVGYDQKSQVETEHAPSLQEQMSFVINDTLIYNNVSQFRDSASVTLWDEIKELENSIRLRSVVMEGKKREYQVTENAEDKEMLRREILEDEEFLESTKRRITELTKTIRRQELKAIYGV